MIQRIIDFLQNRGWQIASKDAEGIDMIPPQEFGLPADYRITIPTDATKVDFNRYYDNLLQIFTDFYNLTKDDLDLILNKDETILKVRIYDDSTEKGQISFVRFEGIIERLKAILTDTASFVIDRSVTSTRVPAEAMRYVNKCSFLQTEIGSFITKIQLPKKELIKDSELFERGQIFGEEINEKLSKVLTFVNENVFSNQAGEIDDEYLMENEDKLNLKLLKDIEVLYDKSDLKNIDFSFHSVEESTVVESQNITKAQILKLTEFIELVSSKSIETKEVEIRGKINSLKSKDPDGTRNNILLGGIYDDMPVAAAASLASDAYKAACEAHRLKAYVTIKGLAKTTKTRIRFIRIDSFAVG
jgi:hypothetical protein